MNHSSLTRFRRFARTPLAWWLAGGLLLAGAGGLAAVLARSPAATPADAPPPVLQEALAVAATGGQPIAFDGLVQAVRQTSVAAQVPGAVVAIEVKAGDVVRVGQVLVRIDPRAAQQSAAAAAAQSNAARAEQDAATREFERQKLLFAQRFISQAALDRAEAQFKSAQATAAAQLATAGAARTQTDFHILRAPYDGVVADVAVVLGDMALPGRALLTVYDPGALRVSATVPESVASAMAPGNLPQVQIGGAQAARVVPVKAQLLPAADAASHTLELRLDLAAGSGARPGMFARVWVPLAADGTTRIFVPTQALWRQGELIAVYVLGEGGRPLLRQVRAGRTEGTQVELLSGVSAGERVALDPQAAARWR